MRSGPVRSAPKGIQAPAIPEGIAPRSAAALGRGMVLEACRLEGCALGHAKAAAVRFEGVHIVGGALAESDLVDLTWIDVVCERCDLSMIQWRGARLTRVVFRGCRLTGCKIAEGALESVRFIDSHADFATFSDSRFRCVAFESCQIREGYFHGADLAGTAFVECDLQGADFSRAKLRGADVSTSNAGGIKVGPTDVPGLVVSRPQAATLATLFGLVVRD
jgi:uncharacterized protein YjbI with pentapeptide repeats